MTQKLERLVDRFILHNNRNSIKERVLRLKNDIRRVRREHHTHVMQLQVQFTADMDFIEGELSGIQKLVGRLTLDNFGVEDDFGSIESKPEETENLHPPEPAEQ